MLLGVYYNTARHNALRLFTGITSYDLIILDVLSMENKPVHYTRLYALVHDQGITIQYKSFTESLTRGIDAGLITRTQVAGNVLYAITIDGKRLLHRFSAEVETIVGNRIAKYGNGFHEH